MESLPDMRVKTGVMNHSRSRLNLSQLARAMDVSVRQIYPVKEDSRPINQRFIVGVTRAFPGRRPYELLYLEN